MKAIFIDAGATETCQPITCTRTLGEIPIANIPLVDIQHSRLTAAGFKMAGNGGAKDLFIRHDAWLSERMLGQLRQMRAPVAVRDDSGTTLAWVGDSATAVLGAETLPPDDASFLIRYPWDLLDVQDDVLADLTVSRVEGTVSTAATIEGTIILGKGSRILPGVYIEGSVIIGSDCKIGPNCYLRGSTSIGNNCHIGQSVEIKNSIIMDHTSIGHLSYCGDSIIASHVNFGAGTITANFRHDGKTHRSMVAGQLVDTDRRKFGAVMGDHVHTGIHTSLYPARKLWPHTSTRPGDIVKNDIR